MVSENEIIYAIFSIAISFGVYFIFRKILISTFPNLSGIRKFIKLIGIAIALGELIYLGSDFKLFTVAAELIASMGVAFGLLSIAFQSYLKNLAAGLGNYLNSDLNIGDKIEISGIKGVIVDMGLTKTTIMEEDGSRYFIPNLKFNEGEYHVFRKKKPCEHILQIKNNVSPKSDICEECQKAGKEWISLRMCLTCGHVGCDRTSANRHAEKHFRKSGHPLIIDIPDKKRRWCYIHNSYF